MLQIIILFVLCGKIGRIVESKGRKKIGYQFMLIGMWFGGEFLGAILGLVLSAIVNPEEFEGLLLFVFVLGGIIAGSTIAFQIAKNVPPLETDAEFYRGIDRIDSLQAGEHFQPRMSSPSPATDGYTDSSENPPRPADHRIQE